MKQTMRTLATLSLIVALSSVLSGFKQYSDTETGLCESIFTTTSGNPEGLYKTGYHKNYLEAYGTKRYHTLEFKEGNKAVLKVITDNRNSSLKSKTDDCHIETYTDHLQYKLVDKEIIFTCVSRKLDYCGVTERTPACFTYELKGSITDKGIVLKNDLFTKQ